MRDLFSQYQSRINYNLIAAVQFARDNFLYISRAAWARPLNQHYTARSSNVGIPRNETSFAREFSRVWKDQPVRAIKAARYGPLRIRVRKSRSLDPGVWFQRDKGLPGTEWEKTSVLRGEKPRFGETWTWTFHARIRLIAKRPVVILTTRAQTVWPRSAASTAICAWRGCRGFRNRITAADNGGGKAGRATLLSALPYSTASFRGLRMRATTYKYLASRCTCYTRCRCVLHESRKCCITVKKNKLLNHNCNNAYCTRKQ